jgi:hypothetical protein
MSFEVLKVGDHIYVSELATVGGGTISGVNLAGTDPVIPGGLAGVFYRSDVQNLQLETNGNGGIGVVANGGEIRLSSGTDILIESGGSGNIVIHPGVQAIPVAGDVLTTLDANGTVAWTSPLSIGSQTIFSPTLVGSISQNNLGGTGVLWIMGRTGNLRTLSIGEGYGSTINLPSNEDSAVAQGAIAVEDRPSTLIACVFQLVRSNNPNGGDPNYYVEINPTSGDATFNHNDLAIGDGLGLLDQTFYVLGGLTMAWSVAP